MSRPSAPFRGASPTVSTPCSNAEFGHAQSGIINIVTREGGREYHGNVRFTTDELSDAIEQSYSYNNLQASIGGPIKLRFRARDAQAGCVP